MNPLFRSICVLIVGLSSVVQAALPNQKDVFTIVNFGRGDQNYASASFIYSALPFYEDVDRNGNTVGVPWSKYAYRQQGAIVLQDKSVLFYDTQSSKFLTVIDATNKSSLYRLTKKPSPRRICPRCTQNTNDLPFPKAEDVFCIATFPWNKGKHFTSTSLTAALSHFRPIVKEDVPESAIQCSTGNPRDSLIYYPKEWEQVQHSNSADALNGVLVLKNRAVFKWITWTPSAITFENYHVNTYFALGQ